MFQLVLVCDGQNEGPLTMALIFIAQLALALCAIISVCYTSTLHVCRRATVRCYVELFCGSECEFKTK